MRHSFLVRCVVLVVAGVMGAADAMAQTQRVTIVTVKQEKLEGAFRGATPTDVSIELAGQEIKIPVASIAYISFTGAAPAAAATAAAAALPIDTAFAAFAELQNALAVGVLREQYSERLVATMSKVVAFTGGSSREWMDVRLAMVNAIAQYQEPLKTAESWESAAGYWTKATYDLQWAEALHKRGDAERMHEERMDERPLALGEQVEGRLGHGDRLMSREMDRGTENAFNDVWTVDVPTGGNLVIEMTAAPFDPHLTLLDANGKKLDSDLAQTYRATIRRRVPPGTYRIWAGAWKPRDVGNYALRAAVVN
jgi:hypothetical protein